MDFFRVVTTNSHNFQSGACQDGHGEDDKGENGYTFFERLFHGILISPDREMLTGQLYHNYLKADYKTRILFTVILLFKNNVDDFYLCSIINRWQ